MQGSVVRGQGLWSRGLYAQARPGGFNATHQHQLASREAGTDLPEFAAPGARLDDAGLAPAVPHQPHHRLPVPLAHGAGRHADPQRGGWGGTTRRGRPLRLEEVHARPHLREDAGVMVQDAHLHLHRRPLPRSEEHTSELQSLTNLVCRLLLEKKKSKMRPQHLTLPYQRPTPTLPSPSNVATAVQSDTTM